MIQENLFTQDDQQGLEVILSEHPEVRILWARRPGLKSPVEINGINPILHVMVESIAENQINSPEILEVRENFERLEKSGLSKHAARAAIAEILMVHMFDVMKYQKPFDKEKYVRQLIMLGKDSGKRGRNEPCPCGSGLKLKRCCVSVKEGIKVSPFAGRLVLGQGNYFLDADMPDIDGPLHPIL